MERVTETENTIEVFENDIDLYLHEFCKDNDIDDLKRESQSVWNACLMYIQRHAFSNRDILKQSNNIINNNSIMDSTYNSYNYDLIDSICDYYIYITYLYDKECSINGLCKLLNIPIQTIMEWGNNYQNSNRLSTKSFEIYKKLTNEREQSLVAKLVSMKHPTAMAIILNKDYGYNLPGVSKETANKSALTAAELPQLGTPQAPKIQGIADNGGDNTV